ncbi:insulin-like growth factor binding protein [Anaeramoeba flamelloides]|uniref:Insulin-like growth factor binding protein n=1 Tax=Anaeramoeba flamelloides TaxID=1746091 RepID=A0ABQ8ZFN0_9EUKA|nr:insulin-like growth factor binding protein [Anaeramoeba flamelloides]
MTFLQKKTKIFLIPLYFFIFIFSNLELSCCLCESTSNYCTRTFHPERIGYEFQVNTHTENNQENPSIAAIGCQNQKFVICWQSEYQDGSYYGIFAQVFNSTDGSKIDNEFQVNNYTSDHQKEPLIASIGRGSSMGNTKKICSENKEKFVISWQSYGQDGSFYGIYAQVFNSTDHSKIGQELRVNVYTTNNQDHPTISPIYGKDYADDKFVIAWQSDTQDGSDEGIFAQVFNSTDLSKIGPEFQVNTYSEGQQYSPVISDLWIQKNTEEGEDEENDKFVISWLSKGLDGSYEEIYAQVFNSTDHSKIGNEFKANNHTKEHQEYPTITSGEEKYVISWPIQLQDESYEGIFAQMYNSTDNSKIGNEFQVNSEIDNSQEYPDTLRIMGNDREKFVIAWQSNHQDGYRYDIYLKIYDSNTGEALFNDDFLITDDTPNIQNNHEPKITSIGGGDGEVEDRFVITWESGTEDTVIENDGDGSYRGIYAQIFSSKLVCNCYKGFFTNSTIVNECQECPVGTYQDQEGQTDCKKCTVGQYQNNKGSSFCYDCQKGFFQDLEEQTECQKCPVGSYQNQIRQSDCINCPIGTYQNKEGQSYCNDCPLNTYQDQETKTECNECPIGTYTRNLRSTSIDDCIPCEKGTYWTGQLLEKEKGSVSGEERERIRNAWAGEKERERIGRVKAGRRTKRKTKIKIQTEIEEGENQCQLCPSGTYQNLTGQTHCQSCPVGTYNPYEGSTSEQNCLECMMGEYNALESQSSCNLCPIGTYQNSKGQSNCMDCLQGSYTDQEGSTTCELCTSGTYQNENGQSQCKNCDFNTYQQYIGATECLYCPLFSETLTIQTKSIKECFCSVGYYGEPGTNCQKCPDNGICNTFNQQYPLPSEGYWSSKTDLNTLIPCKNYESCPGYEVEMCDSELGYTGYLCSECLSGFYKFEDQCEICPINNNSRLILFFILFVILIILFLIIAKKEKMEEKKITEISKSIKE